EEHHRAKLALDLIEVGVRALAAPSREGLKDRARYTRDGRAERERLRNVEPAHDAPGRDDRFEPGAGSAGDGDGRGGGHPPLAKRFAEAPRAAARALGLDGNPRGAARTRDVDMTHTDLGEASGRGRTDAAARLLGHHRDRE